MYNQEKQQGGLSLPCAEATLFEQAQAGCSESVDLLMKQHERLVRYAVKRQVLFDYPFEEAVQAGRHGLWRAILRYDPHRGTAFSTARLSSRRSLRLHSYCAASLGSCQASV
jgi:DNA-directed RNA polymerase sigma subunit (sigma70/sigma32)